MRIMFLFPFSRFASSHADFRGINFDNSVISIGPYGTGSLSLRGIFQSQVTAQPTPMAKIIPHQSTHYSPIFIERANASLSYENSSIISLRLLRKQAKTFYGVINSSAFGLSV